MSFFKKEEVFDVLLEWLTRIELGKLYDYFKSQEKTSLEDIHNLKEEEIKKVRDFFTNARFSFQTESWISTKSKGRT